MYFHLFPFISIYFNIVQPNMKILCQKNIKIKYKVLMRFKNIILFLSVVILGSCSNNHKVVTIERLLTEMTNREALASFPDPPFELRQFSSYDRATKQPGDPSWFANWDRSMFIRTETNIGRKEYVMLDSKGPGAIVRFWMTFAGENAGKGILRIYFDDQAKPAIEGKALDVLSGKLLTGEPLASSVSDSTRYEMRGHNLYLPLPYSSHCKVTYESGNIKDAGAKTGGEAVYYNINYRTYPSDVKVVSFSYAELSKASSTLKSVQKLLGTRDRGLDKISANTCRITGKIAAGSSKSQTITGSQAIRMIKLKLSPSVNPRSLRTTVLEIVFDGNRTIWCPLGDFFGTGYQLRYSNTWYSSVNPDGTLCAYWVMPFKNTAEIRIHNMGEEDVEIIDGEILSAPWKWDNLSMYFGTSWHQFTHLQTGEMKDNEGNGGPFDINYVELSGKGVYVGDAITLFNTVYAWWGEGDEKIYVNHETFPSHIGTGTEDYYGYAWCRPEKFANHPFIAQPDGSGNFWPGYTVNLRFRALDGIPFTSSLKFDMEMWHWTRATINFAPVNFWYVLPGGKSNIEPDTAGVKAPVVLKRSDIISPDIKNGKIEGENMILSSVTGGDFSYQNSTKHGWSGNVQVFWCETKPADRLTLSFYAGESSIVNVNANFSLAKDYGIFRVYINGKPADKLINLVNDKLTTRLVPLGKFQLMKGENKLVIEVTGTSPDPKKAVFGLDYLEFN
jgi:hypothetical protein